MNKDISESSIDINPYNKQLAQLGFKQYLDIYGLKHSISLIEKYQHNIIRCSNQTEISGIVTNTTKEFEKYFGKNLEEIQGKLKSRETLSQQVNVTDSNLS